MVTRLCVVHTGNFSDAEDCYQNVFFKLFKQMKKGSLPNPKAWLIRVALNECRSVLRYRLEEKHSRSEQHNVFLKGRQRHRDT